MTEQSGTPDRPTEDRSWANTPEWHEDAEFIGAGIESIRRTIVTNYDTPTNDAMASASDILDAIPNDDLANACEMANAASGDYPEDEEAATLAALLDGAATLLEMAREMLERRSAQPETPDEGS